MGCCRTFWCSYLGVLLLVIFVCIRGQKPSSDGFINIDCGLASNTSYFDSFTGLTYVSDDQYIDTGVNSNVYSQYTVNENYTGLQTLRSFPSNIKNCYTLRPATEGLKYLVRATFFYGNYDKTGNPPNFDLYLGVNFWSNVNISTSTYWYPHEIIAIAPANYIQVCLVNTGHGTPFISVLELRPINSSLYKADPKQSLKTVSRTDIGSSYKDVLRFAQDVHDRLWFSYMQTSWTAISTSSLNDTVDLEVPSLVLQTAVIPSSSYGSIDITWSAPDVSVVYFIVLHFAEVQVVPNNSIREFYVYANGEQGFKDPLTLDYHNPSHVWYIKKLGHSTDYNISLKSTERATLPPILNAFELYAIVPLAWLPTDNGDGTVINIIKTSYSIRKDWTGDPCMTGLSWTGVSCSIDSSSIPRITALNLSFSGLTGTIISAFGFLSALESLDLSRNNMSGNLPGSLDQLVSLTFLDLSGNNGLSTALPSGLQKKLNSGHLTVVYSSVSGAGHKKSLKAVIIVAVVVIFLIVGAVTVLFFLCLKNKEKNKMPEAGRKELNIDKRKFSFAELKLFTNNFRDQIGVGGFGKVFKGCLDDGNDVAVKVRSEFSSQGIQQFLNEVEKLSRVHHKNLVSLVGYCKDGDHIALVYEYMQEGNLQEWLSGSANSPSWKKRVQIAFESAQGLEYLHKMCNPPLIHRDVKTSNILLAKNHEAKISDFGLVRDCNGTHVSTQVVGTPGYLDPHYASTLQLTEKSDVYSFGVVMLEIVTGKSPILQGPEGGQHLTQFVQQELSKGNIESILDSNMGGQYNLNSIWKVAALALRCTDQPAKRPDMTAVVTDLKECLNLELSSNETSSVVSGGLFKK